LFLPSILEAPARPGLYLCVGGHLKPTKYETILNLETGKTPGFDVPPMLLARADEVIE